jgi:hypothetical protein
LIFSRHRALIRPNRLTSVGREKGWFSAFVPTSLLATSGLTLCRRPMRDFSQCALVLNATSMLKSHPLPALAGAASFLRAAF